MFQENQSTSSNAGKYLILCMVLIGLAAGIASVLYHSWRGGQALEFWGADEGQLILHAPQVLWFKLENASAEANSDAADPSSAQAAQSRLKEIVKIWAVEEQSRAEQESEVQPAGTLRTVESATLQVLQIDGQFLRPIMVTDISKARGLIHMRGAFIEDHSFDWTNTDIEGENNWSDILYFVDGDQHVAIAIDFDRQQVMCLSNEKTVSITPIGKGLKKYFSELEPANQK